MKISIELSPEQGERLLAILASINPHKVCVARPSEQQANGAAADTKPLTGRQATVKTATQTPAPTLEDLKTAILEASARTGNAAQVIAELERLTGYRRAAHVPEHMFQQVIDAMEGLN